MLSTTTNINPYTDYQAQSVSFSASRVLPDPVDINRPTDKDTERQTVNISDQAKELEQEFRKDKASLEADHAKESQALEREYRLKKNQIEREYNEKKRSLDISIYI